MIGFSSCEEKAETDAEQMCLVGDVHKLTEYKYLAVENFGNVECGEPYREEKEWDREIIFNRAGNYDTVHLVTKDGEMVGSIAYAYNKEGQKVCETNFDAQGNILDKIVSFYKDGKRSRFEKYNVDESLTGRVVFEYDDENKMKYTRYYNYKGEMYKTVKQQLSKRDLPLVTKVYDKNGELVYWREEKYNSNNLCEKITFKAPDGTVNMTTSFLYDEHGNVVSQTGTDETGKELNPITRKYKFDDRGNWLTCVEYEGEKPVFMTVRTIEYY